MGIFSRRPKAVAVLGCGPAGMFAAHAFHEAGWDVAIFSKKRVSQMYGAQYLIRPIPGLAERQSVVNHVIKGTLEDFFAKVYGPRHPTLGTPQQQVARLNAYPPDGRGSRLPPDKYFTPHAVWDIRAAYYDAYERYEHMIVDRAVSPDFVRSLLANKDDQRYVINTIPLNRLCDDDTHQFLSKSVWAAGDAPEEGRYCPIYAEQDTVLWDATSDRAWYRLSNIFGHTTCEWPEERKPPVSVAEVIKPISHNCDCWTDPFIGLGRYGSWRKGTLSSDAYEAARALAAKR